MSKSEGVPDNGRGMQGGCGPRAVWRLLWRTAMVAGWIAVGVAEVVIRRPATRQARAEWLHRVCGHVVRGLGAQVELEGRFPEAGAVVVNHQSYFDILVLASLHRCVFVSKAEVGRWPVVGFVATMAGTVFVERGAGGSAAAASVGLRAAANDGLPVVFFPEGTTSNGEGLLPFRSGLLAEARIAELPVRVGVMRYSVRWPAQATVEDDVAYWGDRTMLRHMARFLTLDGLRVRVRFAEEPVVFHEEERKAAAVEVRTAMMALGRGELRETSPV